jgi:hypothetical protein
MVAAAEATTAAMRKKVATRAAEAAPPLQPQAGSTRRCGLLVDGVNHQPAPRTTTTTTKTFVAAHAPSSMAGSSYCEMPAEPFHGGLTGPRTYY